jgi:hypothetical protein
MWLDIFDTNQYDCLNTFTVAASKPNGEESLRQGVKMWLLPRHKSVDYKCAIISKKFFRNSHKKAGSSGRGGEDKIGLTEQLMLERSQLQGELHLIEALELRNEAQLMSFVDADAQWKSLSSEEQTLLLRRPVVEKRLDEIDNMLMNLNSQQ